MYYITIKRRNQKRGHKQFFFDEITARAQFNRLCILGAESNVHECVALCKENPKDYYKPIIIKKVKF